MDRQLRDQLKVIGIHTQEQFEKLRSSIPDIVRLTGLSEEYTKYLELKTFEALATVLMFVFLISSVILLLFDFDDLLLGIHPSRILFSAGLIALLFRIVLHGRR